MFRQLHYIPSFLKCHRWLTAAALAISAGFAYAMNGALAVLFLSCLSIAVCLSPHRMSLQLGLAAVFGSLAVLANLWFSTQLDGGNHLEIFYIATKYSAYDSYFRGVSMIYLFPLLATVFMTVAFRIALHRRDRKQLT